MPDYSQRITRRAIPDSLLIQRLCESSDQENKSQSHPTDFVGRFNRFADHVAPLLSQTNLLFTEFTPHDEANHISSLFRLTDELLGGATIEQLNAAECFLLACSLYGHDWGMAVPDNERIAIQSSAATENFALIDDEFGRLQRFAQAKGLGSSNLERMPVEDWRDYVRLTHAERADARVRAFFSADGDRQLGEALGTLCASHWYDIRKVRALSKEYAVVGWKVNLRALSIFIRLIDMFDISANRTPFKLWKFVNPQNDFSALEWAKHESLSPVVTAEISPDVSDRKIIVQGSTQDHKVYAALQDLRAWCTEQFKENRDVILGEGSLNPHLNWTEWPIEAQGFEPVDIRFEFDRNRMFDVLSNEIYDGDPFVFLRELLQNSRDAIELRKAVLAARDTGVDILGRISITVESDSDGHLIVTVEDNGIGMTEQVIRNYLSRIGSSYYGSAEFASQDFAMNPISRFGLGILSCFMVADRVSVRTQRDPMESASSGFSVEISDYRQQFRIRKIADGTIDVGTKVTVFAKRARWPGYARSPSETPITDYISTIAEGISADIVVEENGTRKRVYASSRRRPTMDQDIRGVTYSYDRERVFEPQELPFVDEFLQENTGRFNRTVGGIKIGGAISYFTLKPGWTNVKPFGFARPGVLVTSPDGTVARRLRHRKEESESVSLSCNDSPFGNLYLNGILVPDADIAFEQATAAVPLPRIVLEVEAGDVAPTLSRRGIKSDLSFKSIARDVYVNEVRRLYGDALAAGDSRERFRLLGEILTCFHVAPEELSRLLPRSEWPAITFAEHPAQQIRTWSSLQEGGTRIVMSRDYSWRHSATFQHGWCTDSWLAALLPETSEVLAQVSELENPQVVISSFGNLTQRTHPFAFSSLSKVLDGETDPLKETVAIKPITTGGRTACVRILSPTFTSESDSILGINCLARDLFGSLDFAEFAPPANELVLWIQLSCYEHDNRQSTSSATFNFGHPFGGRLVSAIQTHEEIEDNLTPIQRGQLIDSANAFPLKGVMIGYAKNSTGISIIGWAINYINAVAQLSGGSLIDGSLVQEVLQPKKHMACYG